MCDWNIVLFAISNVLRVGISRIILGGKNSAMIPNHGFIYIFERFPPHFSRFQLQKGPMMTRKMRD